MALKLFRRKSKAAKEPKAETKVEKKVKVDKKVVEVGVLPELTGLEKPDDSTLS